jgi:hypothetical protein
MILSIFAYSQPTQAQALPPLVRVEMQPSNPPNPWMHAADVAVPAFIGALSAWIGVLLTISNNRKQWDRQTRFTAKQKHYETVLRAVQKEGRLLDKCCEAFRTGSSADGETLEAMNKAQQEGLNAMAVAALYMPDALFRVHSQLTMASARLRKALTPPYHSADADKVFGEYSELFASFINTARADLGYKQNLPVINRSRTSQVNEPPNK